MPSNIMTVLIDEKSLKEYGRWPWGRKLQAELVRKVMEAGPVAVGLDIFYPEPESPEADNALAGVFGAYRDRLVVALGFEVEEGKVYEGDIDESLYDYAISGIKDYSQLRSMDAFNVLLPPDPIRGSAVFGHVYTLPDRDGKLRWDNLYIRYGDEYFPSFALQVVRIAKGITPDRLSILGGSGVDLDGFFVPSDEFGRLSINYLGREGTIMHRSAADVLAGRVPESLLRDRIVLIGTSAISTYDMKITPFSANMSGVEKNATVIANMLRGEFMRKSPVYFDLLVVLLSGIAALFMGRRKRATGAFMFYAALTAILVMFNQAAFTYFHTRVNLTYPLLTVLCTGTFIISYRYFTEELKAREIRKMFSSYVTERVVNELIKNPEMAKLGGERREVTVLFSDISGFTTFSENHEPEEVVSMLNEYLTAMTEVIFRWEGTLDKFIGDAIVAFWGAPLEQKNHAELAVRCSLHMIKRLKELQQKWTEEGRTPLDMGIGLHTGEVLVGNIGAEGKKMDYTVIGDHVNLGARVESLTRKFRTSILMTEVPMKGIDRLVRTSRIGHVSIKGAGNVVVKGRKTPVKIYKIRSLDPTSESEIHECDDDSVIHMKEK